MKKYGNKTRLAAIAAACALALCSGNAYAHGGPPGGMGGGRPSGIGGGPPSGMPGGMPQGNRPATPQSGNPNGTIPARATSAPDTDRGHSEGKGKTDTARVRPTVGKVASFNGTTLTLTLPNGQTKTFTVDAHAYGQLRPQAGSAIAVDSDDGVNATSVAPANQTIRGTVTGVSRDSVTLMLPNGKSVTVMVPAQAAGHIPLTPGSKATVTSHDGGFSADVVNAGVNGTASNKGMLMSTKHRHRPASTSRVNAHGTAHANVNSSKNPNGVNGTATNKGTATPAPNPSPTP